MSRNSTEILLGRLTPLDLKCHLASVQRRTAHAGGRLVPSGRSLATAEDSEEAIMGVPETLADRASTNPSAGRSRHADRDVSAGSTRLVTIRSSVSTRMLRLRSSATRVLYDETNPQRRGLALARTIRHAFAREVIAGKLARARCRGVSSLLVELGRTVSPFPARLGSGGGNEGAHRLGLGVLGARARR